MTAELSRITRPPSPGRGRPHARPWRSACRGRCRGSVATPRPPRSDRCGLRGGADAGGPGAVPCVPGGRSAPLASWSAAVFTCEDSPGRRSSGTGWCQERRRSTTPPWPTSGRGGSAAGTLCWTRPPCVCSARKTAAVHGAGVSCCTPTTNRRTPTSGNCGSRWSATRSANTRAPPRRAAAHRTNPPPYAWSTPTAAHARTQTSAAAQHLCPSASPRGLLEPDAVGAARPVLRGRGRSNASPLPGGLELDDPGLDASALSEFRARLVEGGRADALLRLMLQRLKDAGLVKAGGRQRTDSTHVLACVRRLNRIETVGEGLRAALEEIARISPGWIVPLLREGWDERYGRKVETTRLLGRKNASAQALAAQIGADGQALLAAVDADPTAAWINELPQVKILRILWDQHYTATSTGRLRFQDAAELPTAAQRLHSPYDPDARYSTKGKGGDDDLEWVGSKAHLSESCDADTPNLVTDVHTTPATEPDVVATTAIQAKLIARGLAPGEHLLDAGYPSADNIAASAARGITLVAPVVVQTGRNARHGTFGPGKFTVDWQAGTARCPAGQTSRSMRPDKRGLVTFAFSCRDCRPCPIRDQCTLADPNVPRRVTIHPEPVHQARMTAQRAQDTHQWRTTYNVRAGIEGTVSQAVRGPDLRHARATAA